MQVPQTDIIANVLAIRLFLFGLAAMSFYEALKLEQRRAYVAWIAFLLFASSGVALTPISRWWPVGVSLLSQLVAEPLTWFVLAMSAYLILRPRWSSVPQAVASSKTAVTAALDDDQTKRDVQTLLRVTQPLVAPPGLSSDYQNLARKVEKLTARVDASAMMVRVAGGRVRVAQACDRICHAWNEFRDNAANNSASPQQWAVAVNRMTAAFQQLPFQGDEGFVLDLDKHPNFDKNNMIAAEEDERITDPRYLMDYRRLWDQRNTAIEALNILDSSLSSRENRLREVIIDQQIDVRPPPLIEDGT